MSYRIVVTRIETTSKTERERVCTKETPTDKRIEKAYGNGSEVAFEREYEMVSVEKSYTSEQKVYEQVVNNMNLVAVIDAVNAREAP